MRLALQTAKSQGISALPRAQQNLISRQKVGVVRRDATREKANFIAVFLSELGVLARH